MQRQWPEMPWLAGGDADAQTSLSKRLKVRKLKQSEDARCAVEISSHGERNSSFHFFQISPVRQAHEVRVLITFLRGKPLSHPLPTTDTANSIVQPNVLF